MVIRIFDHSENTCQSCDAYGAYCDDGEIQMTHAYITTRNTRYAGKYIKTMTVGGVGTDPRFRRQGCVRKILEQVFPKAGEKGWVVSLLHPFSYAYYRKFGYEKVSEHRTISFPMSALDFLPRYPDLVPLDAGRIPDVLDVFERFSQNRNLTFQRCLDSGAERFPIEGSKKTYLYYSTAGTPEGYLILEGENHYEVNRMVSDNLHVYEMGYTNRTALLSLLSFLRMFEGEFDTVKLHDVCMLPEVDLVLKHYTHTDYTIMPDIMARVLDTEAILRANAYPKEHGVFRVRVDDLYPLSRGVFQTEYQDGACEVTRLSDDCEKYDFCAEIPAFTRMVYGFDEYNAEIASYMDGVSMKNAAEDFFRAFPKRINGLYEHF